MANWTRGFGASDPRQEPARPRRWLPIRLAIYATVVVGLLVFRVVPSLRARMPRAENLSATSSLQLSGVSLAPRLIESLMGEFRSEYPKVEIAARPGGTTQALEDLINRRTDVAFLARTPTEAELRVIRDRGDSVSTFRIALGGIAVLAPVSSPRVELDVQTLRGILNGAGGVERLYVPEPNRGLWDAATTLLESGSLPPSQVRWLESEDQVVTAVAGDSEALGLASTLALGDSLEARGVRLVPVRRTPGDRAFTANPQSVAAGEYPLFHYLYVSCRPGSGALTSGFVTYLFSGRGQRLVSRAGFLPARDVPRLIQLASRPIGGKGS